MVKLSPKLSIVNTHYCLQTSQSILDLLYLLCVCACIFLSIRIFWPAFWVSLLLVLPPYKVIIWLNHRFVFNLSQRLTAVFKPTYKQLQSSLINTLYSGALFSRQKKLAAVSNEILQHKFSGLLVHNMTMNYWKDCG